MKSTKRFPFMSIAVLAGLILVVTMSSCAVRSHFLTSSVVPAAQGTVEIKKDKNNNYVIKIEISNLSPSTRLTPPRNAYVVWVVLDDNSSRNLGQINSNEDFMPKNLNASFETLSSSKPVKIVITAENDPGVQYPSFSDVILTTDYLNIKK